MDPLLGEIIMFAGNFAPRGWALCNGQLLSIAQNTALFSILGTTYGGDGVTTFALPDLRGRVAIQPGTGPGLSTYNLGERAGTETNTLTISQLPAHNHMLVGSSQTADQAGPGGHVLATEPTGSTAIYNSAAPDQTLNAASISPTGNNQPVNNIQPFLCVNFIIALEGVFPSRN